MIPLIAFVLFGLYVRREAERLRAEDRRPRVSVKLQLAGDGMASPEELHARQAIEDEIERRGIGSIADAGSGGGWAYLEVAVPETGAATEQIRSLLQERGLLDRTVVSAASGATQEAT